MGDESANQAGEAALVRAVRALDQGDIETTAEKLERVWTTLSQHRRGHFHGAEEMLLRWLLKNMTGSTPAAERIRRFPQTWNILAAVFNLIPLFSLAKSLADRRFVPILQQTLKDISAPKNPAATAAAADGSDVEMADAPPQTSPTSSRKRKRSVAVSFDLDTERQAAGCIQTAEAVYEALRVLLSRCELKSLEESQHHRMGAEHIKTLFSTSATDSIEQLLVPFLAVCGLAADNDEVELSKEQSSWMATFGTLWDLHLQDATDAAHVATHISEAGLRLLAKLTKQDSLAISPLVREQWTRDLRRFLSRNVILPARTAFLNKRNQDLIKTITDVPSAAASSIYPVLFDLVSNAPRVYSGKTTKKDYEAWVQTVFDAIVKGLKNQVASKSRVTVASVLQTAAEKQLDLSASSLRSVCTQYALRDGVFDWQLLLCIIRLNPDVFLLSQEGQDVLGQILEKTEDSASLTTSDFGQASQFVVLLADGYAKARDLFTFFKTWLKYLALAEPGTESEALWTQKELVNTVARLLESSLNTRQLVEIVDWLSSQTQPAESRARIHILEAVATGISHEEFVDAANMKTFEAAFLEKYSKKEPASLSVSRWTIAERSVSRGTLDESARIWSEVKSDIKRVLKKSPVYGADTFAAFKCCVATWLSNHRHGVNEDEAAGLVCDFIDRLENDEQEPKISDKSSATRTDYMSWILVDSSKLLSLLTEKKGGLPKIVSRYMSSGKQEKPEGANSTLEVSQHLLENNSSVNSQKLAGPLVDTMIELIGSTKKGGPQPAEKAAVQSLLQVSGDVMSKQQRATAMEKLVFFAQRTSKNPEDVEPEYWTLVLSLMFKLMNKPTFYAGMKFSHLETVGKCTVKIHRQSSEKKSADEVMREREAFQLLGQLALRTIRQMTIGSLEEREKTYLKEAVAILRTPCKDSDILPRLVLLSALIVAAQDSSSTKKLEEAGVNLEDLRACQLLEVAKPIVVSGKWRGKRLLPLLTALEALDVLDHQTVVKELSESVQPLLEASDRLIEKGHTAGWEVRKFLAKHFVEKLGSPLKVRFSPQASAEGEDDSEVIIAAGGDTTAVLEYLRVVIQDADEETRLGYLKELLAEQSDEPETLDQLVIIRGLIERLNGNRPSVPTKNKAEFDLALIHSLLCSRLSQAVASPATTPAQFSYAAKTIHLLLDQKATGMTQWNIDLTLSTVSAICASSSSSSPTSQPQQQLFSYPKTYEWLCLLVEIIIKRHRKRLDGHFHALVATLQSLLRLLLQTPSSLWETVEPAKHYARLLTLICEPTVASVSFSSSSSTITNDPTTSSTTSTTTKAQQLDSEKDKAKRYAGQFMYLIVMQYIKLQLEIQQQSASTSSIASKMVLPRAVRDALEAQGMFSVLAITTDDYKQIVTNSMDASGRVVLRELIKKHQKFGKWSGV